MTRCACPPFTFLGIWTSISALTTARARTGRLEVRDKSYPDRACPNFRHRGRRSSLRASAWAGSSLRALHQRPYGIWGKATRHRPAARFLRNATFAPIAALFNDFTSKSLPLRGTDMTVVVTPPRVPRPAVGGDLLHLSPIPPPTAAVSRRWFFLLRQLN